MPTRFQVLIPIGIAAVIVGVAGIISMPSEIKIDANSNFFMDTIKLDDKTFEVYIADTDPRQMRGLMWRLRIFLLMIKACCLFLTSQGIDLCG